jgi:hypothetical protein
MIRKLTLALGAAAVLGVTALAPTSASAWGWKHHHHFHGFGLYVPAYDYVASPDCYVVQKTYVNKWGKLRVRNVTVCD